VRASTSDLLPTVAAIVGQPLPQHPLDGIDLAPVLHGTMTARPTTLHFWEYQAGGKSARGEPYIDPELQKGTTPLVKKMGGKATRDFTNFRHPVITEEDYLGPRSIIEGDHKLVIHEQKSGEPKIELFDLKADPAEKTNLAAQQPELVTSLQAKLRDWQRSVLKSLTGADYRK
jgi:arylsulfatase A-like enzyme